MAEGRFSFRSRSRSILACGWNTSALQHGELAPNAFQRGSIRRRADTEAPGFHSRSSTLDAALGDDLRLYLTGVAVVEKGDLCPHWNVYGSSDFKVVATYQSCGNIAHGTKFATTDVYEGNGMLLI